MNKRQKKKASSGPRKEIVFIKLYINKNDKYCPEIKFKSWAKAIRATKKFTKLYKCDIGFCVPRWDKLDKVGE